MTAISTAYTTARGNKHICLGCSTRFYDMTKTPAACPQCGQKVPVVKASTRRGKRAARDSVVDGMSSMQQGVVVATEHKAKGVRWR